MSKFRRKAIRFIYGRVLHADDTPHKIALGAAIGAFVAFTPTVGFQMVIAVAIAAALRANKAVCVPLVWITNPLTLAPIYWFCWRIGAGILPGGNPSDSGRVLARISRAAESTNLASILEWNFWSRLMRFIGDLGAELWVGCAAVGLVCGAAMYGLSLWGVSFYRARRKAHMMRRDAARANRFLGTPPRRTPVGVRESA